MCLRKRCAGSVVPPAESALAVRSPPPNSYRGIRNGGDNPERVSWSDPSGEAGYWPLCMPIIGRKSMAQTDCAAAVSNSAPSRWVQASE